MPSPRGALSDWIAGLPQGAEVHWHEPSLTQDQQWASSWMDIYLSHKGKDAPDALTVVGPGAEVEPGDIQLPYDAVMEIKFQGEKVSSVKLNGPGGRIDLEDQDLKRQIEESWNLVWRPRLTPAEGEGNRWEMEVWSRGAIQGLLKSLREGLRFSQAQADPSDLDIDRENLYRIGEEMYATEGAMDQLLALDPDEAAKITAQLRSQAQKDTYPPGQ